MFVKRFVAKDMQEAIKQINAEFGPDAVILQNKSIRKKGVAGLFSKKMVEVVAAYEPARNKKKNAKQTGKAEEKPVNETEAVSSEPAETPAVKQPENSDIKADILSRQMDELKDAVMDFSNKIRIVNKETTLTFSPEILNLYNGLLAHDVQEDLSKEIAAQAQTVQSRKSFEAKTIAHQLIIDKLGEPMPLKLKKFSQNVLLFIGPTGAGKTTSLAKLAGMLKFGENLDVGIINTDTYRVGAMEQIKIYSEIMNIPLITAYTPDDLKQALKTLEDKDIVLIDTAGKSIRETPNKSELEGFVTAANADEVFLVISVSTGYKACRDIISNYSFIPEYKLIVTKLDEVEAWGNVLNIADFAKKSLSYVTVGQNVPDDIRQVDINTLANNITGEEAAV